MSIINMFDYTFMQNALIMLALASIASGIIGSLIVVNKMSSFVGSIAHASFGGLGLAYLVGLHPMLGASVFAVGAALGIGAVSGRHKIGTDTAMSSLWATGMALGLVFIKISGRYSSDLMSWLFGSLLTVSKFDIFLSLSLDVLVMLIVFFLYKELLAISYDSEFVRVKGVSVGLIRGVFLVLAALSTIVLMKVTGLIMVIALLTIPAAVAEKFSNSLWKMMLWAILFCFLFGIIGLVIAWHFDLPAGPSIILVASLVYFITLGRKGN